MKANESGGSLAAYQPICQIGFGDVPGKPLNPFVLKNPGAEMLQKQERLVSTSLAIENC